MKFSRLFSTVLAAVCGFSAATASANTIQPIFQSVTPLDGGKYSYVYDLQLSPNNGLSSSAMNQSGVIIFDFGHVFSATVNNADWAVLPITLTGGSTLGGVSYTPYTTTMTKGTRSISNEELDTADNVTVAYIGLANVLSVPDVMRSMVLLTVVSDLTPGVELVSISRTKAGTVGGLGIIGVETGTQPITRDLVAATPVPVPAAAWAGLSMLGACGTMGAIRRRRRA